MLSPAGRYRLDAASLDLRDENDVCLSYTPLRGEAIQHAILHEVAIGWGLTPLWQKATPTVYEFSVNSRPSCGTIIT
jgi:hypothetical protein